MSKLTFDQARQYGFHFPGAMNWIEPGNVNRLAQDAAFLTNGQLVTTANTTVPVELLAYIDPMVIEILTAPRRAREIFDEEKKGDWTTPYAKWRTDEIVGATEPYSDFADGVTSGVNTAWNTREQYVFQTSIYYGDLEVDMSSVAKINLAAAKQRSAATIIDIDENRFYLLGIAGRNIYGILNDPNLPAAVTPEAVPAPGGTGTVTKWTDKSTVQIYNDILKLFTQLSTQSNGLITNDTRLKLLLPPSQNYALGRGTDFNITVARMLEQFFPNLEIIIVPELHDATAGDTAIMLAPEVNGQRTGMLAFGDKIRAGRLIPHESSFTQKYVSSTYGGVVLQPFAIAQMTGI
jgi:hypothetical protein